MDGFVNRLKFMLDYLDISASFFADKIGVQRSSLSHLLSGRNKPSLDLILKINETYPEFNLEWLLKGENNFLNQKKTPTLPLGENFKKQTIALQTDNENSCNISNSSSPIIDNTPVKLQELNNNSEIENIVVFYKNGTFKKYNAQ